MPGRVERALELVHHRLDRAAELTSLPESHEPFLRYIESLQTPGARTARVHYGARGFVVHALSNIWGFTAPGDRVGYGQFPAATGWLARHLWDSWDFSRDPRALRRVRNILERPEVALIVDEYQENWDELAWVLVRGSVL